jgi:hypothetical protein
MTIGAAGAASAATLVAATGTPLTYAVHNPGGQPDGTLLTENTVPGGYLVDYSSTSILHDNGNSGGFATVTGVGGLGGNGFADLTIDPENPVAGFTAIKFNLILPGNSLAPGNGTTFDWNTRIYLQGGGFQDFLDTTASGPDRYLITADPGQVITRVVFSALDADYDTGNGQNVVHHTDVPFNFDGIEQVSLDGLSLVPEPATWAMMLAGFGAVGFAMRGSRRKRLAAA